MFLHICHCVLAIYYPCVAFKPSSYNVSHHKSPRLDMTPCQNLPPQQSPTVTSCMMLLRIEKKYSERKLHDIATHRVASRGFVTTWSYCELGYTCTSCNYACVHIG